MTTTEKSIDQFIESNRQSIVKDYYKFLSFASVSSEPEAKKEVLACADWLSSYIKNLGFEVELWSTSSHPVIFASNLKAGPTKPTLLIYNHYDVQPVDPLEEWKSPPFQPTEINGTVYARGAQDNKGQCIYVLQALKYLIQHELLDVNVKLCIEGEEECGSRGLSEILQNREKQKKLKADYAAIVDMGIPNATTPAITLGIRGIVTMDLEVIGSHTDMHSGCNGGIVMNPIHALVKLLASLRDENGKVTVPGFYDDVAALTKEERQKINFDFDESTYFEETGAKSTGGEKNFSPNERAWIRPTLEVNGINGGYSGAGFKTVIPAKAIAKISCRLVANQEPKKIGELVKKYLEKNAPEGVEVKVHLHPGGGPPVKTASQSKGIEAFMKAFEEIYHKPCQFTFAGGSIPIVAELAKATSAEPILVGLALSSDLIHAPNEHFSLDRIEKGIKLISRAILLLDSSK